MNTNQFEAFYRATYRPLWSYVFRMVTDTDLASDLVQDSFVRYLRDEPRSQSDSARRSYLFTIATNLVKDSWRRGKVHGQWLEETASDSVDTSAEQLPLRLDVAAAMQKLSLMHRSLLWLTYVEGRTHDDTAGILQIQPASVRVLLMRARKCLAEVLREMEIEKESQL